MGTKHDFGKVEPRGYNMSVEFQPHVRLIPKDGHEFAAELSDIFGPQHADIREDRWNFQRSEMTGGREQFDVGVAPDAIEIAASFPSQAREWLETRQLMILKKLAEKFHPQHITSSSALVRGELGIGGDARAFLADSVMHLPPSRVKSIGRPIHVVGLRFRCPPVQKRQDDGKIVTLPSFLDVKIESLAENPNKLYLEARATWPVPVPWDEKGIDLVVKRQGMMTEYVRENLLAFLGGGEAEDER